MPGVKTASPVRPGPVEARKGRSPPRFLLTGPPGAGKTTLVRVVLARLDGVRASGFISEERRGPEGREGFRVAALDGPEAGLATLGAVGPHRIGRYTVHVSTFEAVALPALRWRDDVQLWVMDEIGPMECLSPAFCEAARRVLGGDRPVLATVCAKGDGFIASAKRLNDVELFEVTHRNRDGLALELAARLRAAIG